MPLNMNQGLGFVQQGIKDANDAENNAALLKLKSYLQGQEQDANIQKAIDLSKRLKGKSSVKIGDIGVSESQGPSPGQAAEDTAVGKSLADYEDAGGASQAQRSLDQLNKARTNLSQPRGAVDSLRHFLGQGLATAQGVPLLNHLSEAARKVVDPQGVANENSTKIAVINSLKSIFPGQIRVAEMDQALKTAYDPALSDDENVKRISSLYSQLRQKKASMESTGDYFRKHGGSVAGMPKKVLSDEAPAGPVGSGFNPDAYLKGR